jgi:hypothetical protein
MLDTRHLGSAWGLAGAAGGALLGTLGRALMGGVLGATAEVTEQSLKQATVDDVSGMLPPGKTAQVMEVEEGSTEQADTAARRRGVIISRTPVGG